MPRTITLALLCLALAPIASAGPSPLRFETLELDGDRTLAVAVQVPADFDPTRTYPVLVGPASGTFGGARGRYWGDEAARAGWIVVESEASIAKDAVGTSRRLLDWIQAHYWPEGGKVHAIGFSANSSATFEAVMAMPERFHSVTAMPGYPRTSDETRLRRLRGVTVNLICGERDGFWLPKTRVAMERLAKLGVDVRLEVVSGAGHVLDELAGFPLMQRLNPLRRDGSPPAVSDP